MRNGCGSLAIFGVGSRDAETIVDDLEHQHRDRCLEMINMLERGQCFLRLTQDGAPQPPSSYPTSILQHAADLDTAHADKVLQGVINRTRERFSVSSLTAEFQIAFAHDDLSREDHLKWKSLFRSERRERSKEHANQKRVTEKNRKESNAFGGAANELRNLADHIFGETAPAVNPQIP